MSSDHQQVLFVDDDPNIVEMLKRMLFQNEQAWSAHYATSVDEAITTLGAEAIDLVVTDIRMPNRDGFELIAALQEHDQWQRIPIVVVTGDGDTRLKRRALEAGAQDLLNKPIDREELFARIRNVLKIKRYEDHLAQEVQTLDEMVAERTRQLELAQREVILRLAKACELRDDATGNHVARVAYYSLVLARSMGLSQKQCDLIYLASPLHDIGKIGIPDSILLKPGPLTDAERARMCEHTTIGHDILVGKLRGLVDFNGPDGDASATMDHALLQMAASIALHHHERWDGKGYPQGLSGEAIPIEARIVSVADVYDALRSPRPYKGAIVVEETLQTLRDGSNSQFDGAVLEKFFEQLDEIRAYGDPFYAEEEARSS
jgi:response regulator RpfG family c-di-GMP phosphodiesterase